MTLGSILSTASSGLMAAQAGLRTVSDNVANANTPGYVRKVVNQSSLVSMGQGQGVNIDGVQRVVDRYLESASMAANSTASRAGVLSETDARRHPWRNVVTRALAGGDDPDVDIDEVTIEAGDRLVICSDGLSGVVAPDRFEQIVVVPGSLDARCEALIKAANAAGGPDNITVAMLEFDVA